MRNRSTAEHARLAAANEGREDWLGWGPYLSERQWGTVREDYSDSGDAGNFFTHDHSRFRAYRWGEDGLAGFSDDKQRLCLALALWNGRDPILKERLFGLTNGEGNHGEDVKEYYHYLDATPTHSYMRFLYKYPQAAYPYNDLIETNRRRDRGALEYELIHTGVFDEDRYFDVEVEYAKASPEDILMRVTVHNRGPEDAEIHVLPTAWFRDEWSTDARIARPRLRKVDGASIQVAEAEHEKLGVRHLYFEGECELLFTENETNHERLSNQPNLQPYVKDAFHEYVVAGHAQAVNPARMGTKMAAHHRRVVPAGGSSVFRARLCDRDPAALSLSFANFDETIAERRREADDFYSAITPASFSADESLVYRQALSGMLWSKQFYFYDLDRWLDERGCGPFRHDRRQAPRNDLWHHMYNADVISMPDKWEYPWYAAWDLAFHVTALSLVDMNFAKRQLDLMLREHYLHPNGQMPAYEWNFGDVNPPVHAWATWFTYSLDKAENGQGDTLWLEQSFHKLMLNFTWWVNRKDRTGHNVFEGGFLGLDNIGVFDRSAPLPTGGHLEQADGTAWMALFCQNMLQILIELAHHNPAHGDMVLKFLEHYLWIASAMFHLGGDTGMWDEDDGFFYDVLRHPDGKATRLKVRSIVGLLPLCAATVFEKESEDFLPEFKRRLRWFVEARPELLQNMHDIFKPGVRERKLLSILDETKLRRVLAKMLDENEFLSPYGLRSLSRYHADHPYHIAAGGQDYRVGYLPAESDTGMFGGNSNWRGPIWMPINALVVRALLNYHAYFGDDFKVECPTGSGVFMTLYEVAKEISRRLSGIFTRDEDGRRAVFGGEEKFQTDPHWRDCLLFYEYFHGDIGAGLGASHQTGWTGVIARLMHLFSREMAETMLAGGALSLSRSEARSARETVPAG